MLDLPQILLARNDDEGPMRFIGILVIIGIFIFGNLLQWLQKYQQQKQKQEAQRRASSPPVAPPSRQPMPRQGARTPTLPPSRSATGPRHPGITIKRTVVVKRAGATGYAPVTLRRQPPSQAPPPVPGARPAARRPMPPLPQAASASTPIQPQPSPLAPPAQAAAPEAATAVSTPRSSVASRTSALQAALKSRSVRNIFVLSEILQPPLAIREIDGSRP